MNNTTLNPSEASIALDALEAYQIKIERDLDLMRSFAQSSPNPSDNTHGITAAEAELLRVQTLITKLRSQQASNDADRKEES